MSEKNRDKRRRFDGIARAGSKVQGCTCSPEITMQEAEPGIYSVVVAHDDWCPLIRAKEKRREGR